MAYVDHESTLIDQPEGSQVPAVVYVPRVGPLEVGREAIARSIGDSLAAVFSIKRILGRRFSDPAVRAYQSGFGAAIREGAQGQVLLNVRGTDLAPAQIVAALLTRLRESAEEKTGTPISLAVMSVPVNAPENYRRALALAASLSGLEVLEFVPEPTAGLLAYGFHKERCQRRIAVCDFGGGTLDVACVAQEGLHFGSDVSDGDLFLGGDDFDGAVAGAVAGLVYRQTGVDMTRDSLAWNGLLWRSESAKRLLSRRRSARLHMPQAFTHGGRRRDLSVLIEREWMRDRWAPLIDRAQEVIARMLRKAQWTIEQCDEIVLIGGTMLVPQVRDQLSELFQRRLETRNGAETAVAMGAAAYAAHLAERHRLPARVTPNRFSAARRYSARPVA